MSTSIGIRAQIFRNVFEPEWAHTSDSHGQVLVYSYIGNLKHVPLVTGTDSPPTRISSRRSPEVLIPFIGLVYVGLYFIYLIVPMAFSSGGIPTFAFIIIPFTAIFLLAAIGIWRKNRIAYIASIAVSAIFLVLEGSFASEAFANPSTYDQFFGVVTVFPTLVVTLVYSVLGLRTVWHRGAVLKPPRTMKFSSFFALLALGFIIGGLAIGVFAGATESRLLANSGTTADIVIVQGAANQNNAQFYTPSTFTVKVGQTVTWANRDGTSHTVTSTPGTQFDSGSMSAGDTFKHPFAQAGTYEYTCSFHPWMKGTVVVTSG